MNNRLITWYKNFVSSPIRESYAEYNEILNLTSFLDKSYDNIPLKQRIWHIKNDIYTKQICIICGGKAKYDTKHDRYWMSCSKDCTKKLVFSNDEIIKRNEKRKLTCVERYGVENPSQAEEFKEKSKLTNLERYGVDNFSKTNEFKEKSKLTNLEKYGVDFYSQTKEYKEKHYVFHNKRIFEDFNNILKRDGFVDKGYKLISYHGNRNYEIYCPKCCSNFVMNSTNLYFDRLMYKAEICTNCNPIGVFRSYLEKQIVELIKMIYKGKMIENDREQIKPYELDIYIPNLKLAIEFNGDYFHANPEIYKADDIIYGRTAKEIWEKDLKKKFLCEQKDIKLITIWEKDWLNNEIDINEILK